MKIQNNATLLRFFEVAFQKRNPKISSFRIHTTLYNAYKIGNISETVEDRAKVTINGLYKIVQELSIAVKMYDLE